MTIRELIEALQVYADRYGNMDVMVYDTLDDSQSHISTVFVADDEETGQKYVGIE